jgi:hypothetical protein
LPLTDAFDFGRVQRIDLDAASALILEAGGEIEKMAEALLQTGMAIDTADVAAQAGAQEFELAPGALEPVRVAANHDGGALGDTQIAPHGALGERHQLDDRP